MDEESGSRVARAAGNLRTCRNIDVRAGKTLWTTVGVEDLGVVLAELERLQGMEAGVMEGLEKLSRVLRGG